MTTFDYETLADLCDRRIGRRDVACPECGPSQRQTAKRKAKKLRIWLKADGFVGYKCARCGAQGYAHANGALRAKNGNEVGELADHDIELERLAQEEKFRWAMTLWADAVPLEGTIGWRYFVERRELHLGLLHGLVHCLRWHEGIGAVVALMTDTITNQPTGVHRTFLNSDATKRERKMLGRQGVIRISPDDEVTTHVSIAEGVETTLAILLSGWAPIWCPTSANGIANFPPLSGIEVLTIFQDSDDAGKAAAQSCAAIWTAADREVRLAHPKDCYDEA